MKKLLSLTLAVCLVLSLANAAFAIRIGDEEEFESELLFDIYTDPYLFTDFGEVEVGEYAPVYFGDNVYYCLSLYETDEEEDSIEKSVSDFMKEFKISADWEMGEEYIENVKLTPVLDSQGYINYTVEIETKDMPKETDEQDIIGTITVKAKKAKLYDLYSLSELDPITVYDGKTKEYKLDVAFTVSPKAFGEEEDNRTVTDDNMLFTFDDGMEEETLYLYGNMGRFEVNTLGQGDLIISADVDYNKGIEAIDKDHSYVYYNSNGAVFNKIGTLYLSASYGDTLYKVMEDGTLKELKGNYDTDEDAFKLRTRTLGSYVIAEEKLDLEKVNAAILANK